VPIGDRIKLIRHNLGLSVAKFSIIIEEKNYKIRDCESGKQKVPNDILEKIGLHFHIDLNWLLTGKGSMYLDTSNTATVSVPTIEATAGAGSSGLLEQLRIDHEKNFIFDKRIFPKDFLSQEIAMIRVIGDSMEPFLESNDWAFIQLRNQQEMIRVDDVYLIEYDGEIYIKRLQFQGRRIVIRSDNPQYEPFEVNNGVHFDIVGKVIARLKVDGLMEFIPEMN